MTIYALGDRCPVLPSDGDYWIAPDANVIGGIIVHSGASIWFGVTLRGDNEDIVVGEGTNIQDHCVLHTDMGYPLTIGRNCTVGHKATLHGCTIGDETLVGMGAMVMNGAKVGRNCLIGAGALVTEGKEIPDGSMVLGAPGKVVRQIDEATMEVLRQAAVSYQNNMRRFRDGLKVLPA
ncbi:gamma carbonic anhydrase family protein [Brevirhabdus pacifica]|uniref:Gamma carbonic anhydrase family protein n=1 Tax=Brevirhabdus pacifica TaxID=1267768 RepID=A0A1U7DF89_9RHOB|nr:gamma carbonic anhydrase family protein [Brevirhabdus pacifica]APX88569.1 gamma carbonic anhydrase family protein [Brevirhabdus pacifica]OWU79859.1 anhydrase [Loktanella sp. 22II-4b]PJJ86942.1 carbonic anhydrase/acetyltransferase-like protein (isoleucine patch superfamily) [Brevirhabdus pacifica]